MRNIKYIKLTETATAMAMSNGDWRRAHTWLGSRCEKPSNMANMANTNGFLIRVSVAKRHATRDTTRGEAVLIIQTPHAHTHTHAHSSKRVLCVFVSDGSCCSVVVTAKCNKLQMKSKLIFNKAHKCCQTGIEGERGKYATYA